MSFRTYYVDRGSDKLLIYFNSLAATGYEDNFLLKNSLPENFPDYDILILKDNHPYNWYVPVIPEMEDFLCNLISEKSIKHVFALADSSGAIPLLSCLPNNTYFRKAVIVNGQIDISNEVVFQYEDNIVGSFDESKVIGQFDKKYLKPLELINYSNKFEILFCYNYVRSDKVYADIIKNSYKSNFVLRLDFKKYNDLKCHAFYIADLFTNKNFFEEVKSYFNHYEYK